MINITGKTKQLGLIGDPIEHSFSPRLHNFISACLGADYVYSAWQVKSENLKNAIEGVRALQISGINVTAPHKKEVIKYLDDVDDTAKILGSVNTIVNKDGHLKGYNTDSEGFYLALKSQGIEISGKKILVIGAGGVAVPTLMRIIKENPKSITLLNRTAKKAEDISKQIYEKTGYGIDTGIKDLSFDIVINTTSAGMAPQLDTLPTDAIAEIKNLDFITEATAVVDMIYNPRETKFLKEASLHGAKTVNGLDMLIYQGILAYELFTGVKVGNDLVCRIKSEVFGV